LTFKILDAVAFGHLEIMLFDAGVRVLTSTIVRNFARAHSEFTASINSCRGFTASINSCDGVSIDK